MNNPLLMFESLVNSYRCKTGPNAIISAYEFESLVNSYRCKTGGKNIKDVDCLRALLILIGVKLSKVLDSSKIV